MAALTITAALLLGGFFWTFSEYVLHRWFHTARGKNYASKEHLAHHARYEYILGRTSLLAWAGVFIVGLVAMPLVGWLMVPFSVSMAFGVGWVIAYFVYEWIHAMNHLKPPRSAYGRWTRLSHFQHHFGHPLHNHGVTLPLWDKVFGTYDDVDVVTVPRRLAMVWLLDEHGDVKPEYAATYVVRGRRTTIDDTEMVDAFANRAPAL